MKKNLFGVSLLTFLVLIINNSCQQIPISNQGKLNESVSVKNSIQSIKGVVEFPNETGNSYDVINRNVNLLNIPIKSVSSGSMALKSSPSLPKFSSVSPHFLTSASTTTFTSDSGKSPLYSFSPKTNFSTKATLGEVGAFATVSVINPSNHPIAPNKTIATGLTDNNGAFSINPGTDFSVGDIYILEAAKRIGRTGKELISLRTFIRRTASGWDSITAPDLKINTKTTALTIIADLESGNITPADCIGTMDTSSGSTVVNDINPQVTALLITDVSVLADTVLTKDADPVRNIKFQSNQYVIANPSPITAPHIYGFYPTTGAVGDTIVIGGNNFSTNASENIVTINGVQATVTKSLGDRLHITVPAGADTNFISLQTPSGSSIASDPLIVPKNIPFDVTTNISNNSVSSVFSDITVDIFGYPSIVWEDTSTANSYKDIFHGYWPVSGSAFTSVRATKNTDSYAYNSTSPSIAIDKYGRRFMVFNFGTNIYMSISLNGANWSPPINVGWDPAQYNDSDTVTPNPKIAIGNNKINVAWTLQGEIVLSQIPLSSVIDLNNNLQTVGAWPVITNFSGTTLDSTDPDLVADSRDIVYLTWADKLDATNNPGGFYRIIYGRYIDSTHISGFILSSGTSEGRMPSVTLDNVDRPSVAWRQNISSLNQIYFSKSSDRETSNTSVWLAPKNISNNSNNNSNPSIACDAKGLCYVVWENSTDVYYANSTDLGANTWTTPVKISQTTGTARNPEIIMDELRNSTHISWESNFVDANYDVYHLQKATVPPVASTNRIAKVTTGKGVIKMLLLEDDLPITTQNFINLVNANFYNGLYFHRYVAGFVVQGGDPLCDATNSLTLTAPCGTGGSGYNIPLEISSRVSFDREGMVGMARGTSPDTASSQFYFTLGPVENSLDGLYSLFAVVISGGDVIQSLRQGDQITKIEIINP